MASSWTAMGKAPEEKIGLQDEQQEIRFTSFPKAFGFALKAPPTEPRKMNHGIVIQKPKLAPQSPPKDKLKWLWGASSCKWPPSSSRMLTLCCFLLVDSWYQTKKEKSPIHCNVSAKTLFPQLQSFESVPQQLQGLALNFLTLANVMPECPTTLGFTMS